MNNPTISVLMSVYNGQRYVAEAVESILNQTYSDFEFIIIDDGSTDRSLRILQRYARGDERIRLVSRPNTGYIDALNEMLTMARGKLIARMDADDVSLPQRFERQLAFMRAHPQTVCIGGGYEMVDYKGRSLRVFEELKVGNADIQQAALSGFTPICHPTAMMRKWAVDAVGGYDKRYYPGEDLDLWLRMGEIGELDNLSETVLRYRYHDASTSALNHERQLDSMRRSCESAWRRRGIEGVFGVTPFRHGNDRNSRHEVNLRHGWWIFNNGHRTGALEYGLRVVAIKPLSIESWRLLVCAMIKPMKASA